MTVLDRLREYLDTHNISVSDVEKGMRFYKGRFHFANSDELKSNKRIIIY